MLETVCSVGSYGTAPTLVESKDGRWKSMELESPPLSPTALLERRVSGATLMSPVTPLTPCRLRGIEDGDEWDEEDRILRYPKL